MITLYAFHPGFGMPSGSPFVVKTMIHLAMAKQAYEIEIAHDLSAAPKGKLPYIRDNGDIIADSEMIRKHLETRYGIDFDPGLSPATRLMPSPIRGLQKSISIGAPCMITGGSMRTGR